MQSASDGKTRERVTAVAREQFVSGCDVGDPRVRPEILLSWRRCRDDYKIDPRQSRAPAADDYCDHSLTSARVVAELGSVARSLLPEVQALGGLLAITDGTGRILSALGDKVALRHGEQSNLAPWAAWSEQATGTNGMGTALEQPRGILVRHSEHWCEGLRDWSCAGTSIRDPTTGQPLAVLDVSLWGKSLSDGILPWLRSAVRGIQGELRARTARDAFDLKVVFEKTDRRAGLPLIAFDAGGGVVAVDDNGTSLAGMSIRDLTKEVPALQKFVCQGLSLSRADHSWAGFAESFIPSAEDVVPFTLRPVVKNNRVIGALGTLGESAGEHLSLDGQFIGPPTGTRRRIFAVQGNRLVILYPDQIICAEADRNTVWLTTDRGQIRARARGLEKLYDDLRDEGFIRVHRHFIVNSKRISEVRHGFRGQLSLVMVARRSMAVPVSRRREAAVRKALDL